MGSTERRTKYALEPLQPRPRRAVMPWQRRAEADRLGVSEPKPPKPRKEKPPKPPKEKGRRPGLPSFGKGKKKQAEEKSSEEP